MESIVPIPCANECWLMSIYMQSYLHAAFIYNALWHTCTWYTSTCDTSECNSFQQPWAGHRLCGVLRRHGEHYSCDAFSIIQSSSLRFIGQFSAEKSTIQLYEPDSLFRVCVSRQTMFWVFDVSLVCIPFWYWPTLYMWTGLLSASMLDTC